MNMFDEKVKEIVLVQNSVTIICTTNIIPAIQFPANFGHDLTPSFHWILFY